MKKKLLSLALACGMVFSLAACGTPANNDSPAPNTESPAIGTETPAADTPTYEPATVRVAYMPNLGSAGSLFVGIEQGYFEEVGLTVETFEFQGGPAEIAAMASGDIDISQIGHGAHKLCIQGEAKIFQMDHTTSLSDVVVGNKAKGIETIEDLKGKTVAVSSGTSSEIILEQALARAGMTMDDINTVEMTVDGMTTAMISGQIDAAASWSPNTVTLQNALGDNYVDLGTNADFLDSAIFPSSYICTPEYAEANHDILVRFAQALDKAHDWRAAHPEEMAKLLAKELHIPVILLSQLNRESENRPGGRPELAHLRESGAIEQDADVVMLLYRPAMQRVVTDRESGYPTEGLGVVIVAKQRNGETGNVYFGHNPSMTKIYDYVPPLEYLEKHAK